MSFIRARELFFLLLLIWREQLTLISITRCLWLRLLVGLLLGRRLGAKIPPLTLKFLGLLSLQFALLVRGSDLRVILKLRKRRTRLRLIQLVSRTRWIQLIEARISPIPVHLALPLGAGFRGARLSRDQPSLVDQVFHHVYRLDIVQLQIHLRVSRRRIDRVAQEIELVLLRLEVIRVVSLRVIPLRGRRVKLLLLLLVHLLLHTLLLLQLNQAGAPLTFGPRLQAVLRVLPEFLAARGVHNDLRRDLYEFIRLVRGHRVLVVLESEAA